MAKKLISYDDEAAGLGLPDVVEQRIDKKFSTFGLGSITNPPVVETGPTLLGVVGDDLWAASSATQLARLDGTTWTQAATLPAGTMPRRMHPLANGEVIVNRNESLWVSSGFVNPNTATFTKVLDIPAENQPDTRFYQGWGVDVVDTQVIATEYGVHGKSRYVWYSNDSGQTFQRVFDLHDWPGGSQSGLGGAHMHGVAVNPYDGTLFAIAGDAAASAIFWAEASNPTVWEPIPGQPLKSGVKILPTVAKSFPWGTLLASDDTPNGNWVIPHSSTRNYRVDYALTKRWGTGNNTVVGQHIFNDDGMSWSLFSDGGEGYPGFITAGGSPSTQSVVWEDTDRTYFAGATNFPFLILPHGSYVYVTRADGSYLQFQRPTLGAPVPEANDSGWVLGGTAHPSQQSVAVGFGSMAAGIRAVAIGEQATATENAAMAIGRRSRATAPNAIAIGGNATEDALRDAEATDFSAVAIGYGVKSAGVAIGTLATAQQSTSTALGYLASAGSASSVAVGAQSSVSGSNSVALGAGSSASGRGTALGRSSTAQSNSVALGQESATSAGFQVQIGPRHIEATPPATAPPAPTAGARVYTRVVEGKTQLVAQFPTGDPVVIAAEV